MFTRKKILIGGAVLITFMFAPVIFCSFICPLISPVSHTSVLITPPTTQKPLPEIEGYKRTEESTYLTYPEWHIVYSSEEYADWLKDKRPSGFPYFASIGQFWTSYCHVYQLTKHQYGFNAGDHLMLWVIGVSFSVENAIKSVYENTVGRITEWTSSGQQTEEDQFAFETNKAYVKLIYDEPWYQFSFWSRFKSLWTSTHFWGPNIIRKWERKAFLSLEFLAKTAYGGLIKLATQGVYGAAATEIYASIDQTPSDLFAKGSLVKKVKKTGPRSYIVLLPRYRLFTEVVPSLTRRGVRFLDIAGNDEIFLTALALSGWLPQLLEGRILFSMEIPTAHDQKRLAIIAPVKTLHRLIPSLEKSGVHIEHLYDY